MAEQPDSPATPAPVAPASLPHAAPPRDDRRGPRGDRRPSRGDKPRDQGGKPRTLETFEPPAGPKLRDLDKDIEAEMAAAMSEFPADEMMKQEASPSSKGAMPARSTGGKKIGRVLSIHGGDVFIAVPGGRSEGVMSITQFPEGVPAIGSEVEVDIQGYDPADGLLKLSRMGQAQAVSNWSSVAVGMNVEAKVIETNKGGLSVEINGIRGFMPFRELDIYRVEQPEQFINQKLICEVIEMNPEERNLVVSRRSLMERERERQKEHFWANINVGDVRTGTVRGIKPFGVFVDLGGADGMIPASELAWSRVDNPEDAVKLNQQVQVKVVRIDDVAKKISLSLKALTASPWDTIKERIQIGSQVRGKVTRTAEFGAFVEIEPGIEGLIHISEMGMNRVRRVRDVLQEGREVDVQVVNIDLEQKRIGLSLKAIAEAAVKAADAAAMAEMKAREEAEEAAAANAPAPKPRKRSYELRGGK